MPGPVLGREHVGDAAHVASERFYVLQHDAGGAGVDPPIGQRRSGAAQQRREAGFEDVAGGCCLSA